MRKMIWDFILLEEMHLCKDPYHPFSAEREYIPREAEDLRPTGKCPGGRYISVSLMAGVSSVWPFTYGNRLKDFKGIMEHIHAAPVDHGDIAYQVEIFPGYLDPDDPVGG